jgi:hypothetical protein
LKSCPDRPSKKKYGNIKREEAYYGSPQHFFRSLYKDKLKEEGFEAHDFTRALNRERPPEELIQQKIKRFKKPTAIRLCIGTNLSNLTKWSDENVVKMPYQSMEICAIHHRPGIYAITFPHFLYVVYTKKHELTEFKDVYRPLDMENFETSIITLYGSYALFDNNGTVISNPAPLYEGTWSKAKLSDLLPVDYEPGD